MKKHIFATILGVIALLAIFLVGSICNVDNDLISLVIVLVFAIVLSGGYAMGRYGSSKSFSLLDAGFCFLIGSAIVAAVFFLGSIANVPSDNVFLAILVGFALSLVLGYVLGIPYSKKKKKTTTTEDKNPT